ncbi:uncharacterized protein LOC113600194 [Acinonyx jubatus]|uniref:Uncharacterized protein LOC113600194 n=1 Tax=Acinonyx jubatus TaxID=32536 RepID=A0A6J1ZLE6_ACIJB|nr:uncharacterized protein LOC113600194 [Acinonyx jubatus]
MLKLVRDHIEEGAKITGTPECPPFARKPRARVHLGPRTLSGTRFGGERVTSKIAKAFPLEEALVLFPKPGDWLVGRAEEIPTTRHHRGRCCAGGWSAVSPTAGKDQCTRAAPVTLRCPETRGFLEARRGRPSAQSIWAGWGRRDPGPVPSPRLGAAPGAAESDGTHKAQLSAPTRGVPLADSPPRALKCAPTLALVHCHSHGNSYANSTHIRAYTQLYKHASTRAHTQTRTHVHFPSQMYSYTRPYQAHLHRHTTANTHIALCNPQYTNKQETFPWALNPHVHVHIQTHTLLPPPFHTQKPPPARDLLHPQSQIIIGAPTARVGHTHSRARKPLLPAQAGEASAPRRFRIPGVAGTPRSVFCSPPRCRRRGEEGSWNNKGSRGQRGASEVI